MTASNEDTAKVSGDESRRVDTELRWPVVLAVLVALALYGALPSQFPAWMRIGVVVVGLVMLVSVTVINPIRLNRETRLSRALSVALALVLVVANQVALVILIVILTTQRHPDGPADLLAALQVWITNIVAFGLLFWELDRGGPVARRVDHRRDLPRADFRFPQDEDGDTVIEVARGSSAKSDWVPAFVDYAYLSLTNSMAYSPTDVMPLTSRVKALMGLQSAASFVMVALVIARAVSLLG
ncbi:hypothetical protein ACPEEZ_14865 [Frigoribacterium sp. 2-23]|uniref:hypothetical protein n=1 Tax=Frigoribacterium sp. 2-23 TaxID=3415006 RepID=UPI003C6F7BE7